MHMQVPPDVAIGNQAGEKAARSCRDLAVAFPNLRWYERQTERGVDVRFCCRRDADAVLVP